MIENNDDGIVRPSYVLYEHRITALFVPHPEEPGLISSSIGMETLEAVIAVCGPIANTVRDR